MSVSGEETRVMVAMAEVVVLVVLTAVLIWWFRRTPMYRAHRRTGVVPSNGQFSPNPTWHGQRTNVPPLLPELRPDDDPPPARFRRRRLGSE